MNSTKTRNSGARQTQKKGSWADSATDMLIAWLLFGLCLALFSTPKTAIKAEVTPATQTSNGWQQTFVDGISAHQGYKKGNILVIESKSVTKAAYGGGVIRIDGAMREPKEVQEAYIAHEIAHFEQSNGGWVPSSWYLEALLGSISMLGLFIALKSNIHRSLLIGSVVVISVALWLTDTLPQQHTFRVFEVMLGLSVSSVIALFVLRRIPSARELEVFTSHITYRRLSMTVLAIASVTALFIASTYAIYKPDRASEMAADIFSACHTSPRAMREALLSLAPQLDTNTLLPPWWLLGQLHARRHPTIDQRITALDAFIASENKADQCRRVGVRGIQDGK